MIQLTKTRAKRESIAKAEKPVHSFLPYKCHFDDTTIITQGDALVQVIKVDGFSFETADDEDLDIRKSIRNSLFKNMSSGSATLYFHTIRRKKPVMDIRHEYPIDPTVKTAKDFSNYLAQQWQKKNSGAQSYYNELYVTLVYQSDTAGAAMVEHLFKQLRQKSDKSRWQTDMREMHENLVEMTNRVMSTLRDYGAKILSIVEENGVHYCEILEFLGTVVNCGDTTRMIVPKMPISEYIPTHRLFFGSRSIEAVGPKGRLFAGIVSIKEYGPNTSAGIFDSFLQMPFEFIITQSFSFSNRTVAINQMQLQQNRMIQAEDKAVSQIAEISQALDMAMSGDIGFGKHHFTILCIDDNIKSLENSLSMAAVELSNCGMQSVRERVNMEPCYWGQLPGNTSYLVRRSTVNTLNLAGFAALHNFPIGKIVNNHWGDYVTVLDTTSGTPFYFNFHVRDVGHSLIIGPTGAGKTVLMNFLCAQAQKFKPRMFFFDKDRGAEIFIRALNGIYTVINPSLPCGFNPLQLDDTGENRTFLLEWLKTLVTTHGEPVGAEEIKLLSQAIDGNYRLDRRDRKLSNIVPFLGMDGPGTLASRISMWHGKGSHGQVFDNDEDKIDLASASVFGFEMAELLKDPLSLSPVLIYIFHRINISLDGSRTMLVLDEAWSLIDNPVFAPKIKDWLKVLRKLNAMVIFATQSVEDAAKSRISDTLIQQTATQIFLPNLKATSVYKSAFMLTEREYQLIRTTDPSSRYFLVKQGINAVVSRVNLAGMDNIINVLSGRAESVILLNGIIEKYGRDPKKWLPIFYREVRKLG